MKKETFKRAQELNSQIENTRNALTFWQNARNYGNIYVTINNRTAPIPNGTFEKLRAFCRTWYEQHLMVLKSEFDALGDSPADTPSVYIESGQEVDGPQIIPEQRPSNTSDSIDELPF